MDAFNIIIIIIITTKNTLFRARVQLRRWRQRCDNNRALCFLAQVYRDEMNWILNELSLGLMWFIQWLNLQDCSIFIKKKQSSKPAPDLLTEN